MCKPLSDWERCVNFHGHICPGLAIGYRIGLYALELLNSKKHWDNQLVITAKNLSCAIDPIMELTGCTIGNGKLIVKNEGVQEYILENLKTGAKYRLTVPEHIWNQEDPMAELRAKYYRGKASKEEMNLYDNYVKEKIQPFLNKSVEELFSAEALS
jgi:formylmethanofuran dehydrogenase subunit E